MKRVNLVLGLIAFTSFAILVTGCKKDNDIQLEDKTISQDDAYAESTFENVSDMADEAYDIGTGNHLKSTDGNRIFLSECATVTLDTTVFPRELTIDFGDVNCLCHDGKYRRGKIIITFTGRYRQPGTVITHGFENYYVNDNSVDGTKVVTNMGENENGNLYFTIEVVGVVQRVDDSSTFSWNSSRVREWIQGSNTPNRWDDIYLLTGTAHGTRPNGLTWEKEIINPLRIELACRFIVSGTVEIRPQDRPVRLLDYGTGECDNIATVTVNGETYTIYLH
ncbi:MAG: hypothetical protein M0Q51_07950 [Bacteroidales bacterium]|nr:hypothetical protein [Bacteroidales bacterium]